MATWTLLGGKSRTSTQALTEAAPVSGNDGLELSGITGVVPVLIAPNGQTFTGTGNLRAYYWNTLLGQWVRLPRLDDDLVDATGLAIVAFPSIPVVVGAGRFALLADTIGVSGGTQITLNLIVSF